MSNIIIYYASMTVSREMSRKQSEATRVVDTYKIKYELMNIAVSTKVLEEMCIKVASPKANPPQIVNGQEYCGNFIYFHDAKENKEILKFLKIK
uniref:SH3 domain-binding glutamic acid-rich-like protein 3 n=1 Tax=Mus spicilegus TaxID=10103 RepID=A0A8C6N0L1_MUSSI